MLVFPLSSKAVTLSELSCVTRIAVGVTATPMGRVIFFPNRTGSGLTLSRLLSNSIRLDLVGPQFGLLSVPEVVSWLIVPGSWSLIV